MAFCTLDSKGNITGIYAMPQPQLDGYAVIDDSDARIPTFNAQVLTTPTPTKAELQNQLNAIAAQIAALPS